MESRILVLAYEYTLGGAQAQLRHIIHALDAQGRLTDVYIANSLRRDQDPLLEEDIRQLRHVTFFELSLHGKSVYGEREALRDFVRAHTGRNYSTVLIFQNIYVPLIPFFKELGIPTVYSERLDAQQICEDASFRSSVVQSDILTANSMCAAKRMEKVFGRNIRVVLNGKEPRERIPYRHPKQIRNILVPCRIDPIKNLMLVLDMAFQHKDRAFEIRFVGETQYKKYAAKMKARIQEQDLSHRIALIGYRKDMEAEYAWADLVVLPSLAEGTPNVVLEAFQYGRPVIVSDIESERDIVTDKQLRFSPKDPEELYACIQHIEKMTEAEKETMLETHSRFVIANYSLSNMTDTFIRFLREAETLERVPQQAAGYAACESDLRSVILEHEKKERFYSLLCRWNQRLQKGECAERYFLKRGQKEIAIYGFRELGELLYQELNGSSVKVKCILDKNADQIDVEDIPVLVPEAASGITVDAVVVTAVTCFDQIQETWRAFWDCEIISLEDIIYGGEKSEEVYLGRSRGICGRGHEKNRERECRIFLPVRSEEAGGGRNPRDFPG